LIAYKISAIKNIILGEIEQKYSKPSPLERAG
jgi:hypothetical protein